MNPAVSPFVEVLGWTLLHFLWQGTVVAAALAFVLVLLPRRWSGVRYGAACLSLLLMAAAPIATGWVLVTSDAGTPAALVTARSAAELGASAAPAIDGIDREALLAWLVGAWIVGVTVSSARLAGGWWQARRLAAVGTLPAGTEWQQVFERVAVRLRIRRPVHLRESTRVHVPMVIGWLRPVLLLPVSALAGLTPRQVEALFAHELAHIRRHDYAVNLLQSAVETLLFYHPAVWWVSHTIRTEREHCCDDLAVRACGDAVLYAGALTALEAIRQERLGLAMAASGGSLLARVRRVLGVPQQARLASSGWVVAVLTALMVSGAGLTGHLGRLGALLPDLAGIADAAMAMVEDDDEAASAAPQARPAEKPRPAPAPAPQPQPTPERASEIDLDEDTEELGSLAEEIAAAASEGAMAAVEASSAIVEETLAAAMAGLEAHLEVADETGEDLEEMLEDKLERQLEHGIDRGVERELEAHARQLAERASKIAAEMVERHAPLIEEHQRKLADALAARSGEFAARAREMAREIEQRGSRELTPEQKAEVAKLREEARRVAREARAAAREARIKMRAQLTEEQRRQLEEIRREARALAQKARRLVQEQREERRQERRRMPPPPPDPPPPPPGPPAADPQAPPPPPPPPPAPPKPPAKPPGN